MSSEKISVILLFCVVPLFADSVPGSLDQLIGAEQAAILRNRTGPLSQAQLKDPKPVFLPNHEKIRQLVTETQKSLQPSIIVETLFLYRKPLRNDVAGVADGEAAGPWTEAQRIKLYNQALGISTLAGIQYFSASRNTMRTFYETSRRIDSPDTKKPLPDPEYPVIPQSLTIYARQKDLTFGDNIYQYDYYSYPNAFIFVQENLTAMNAGIIPVLGKNKLRSFIAVYDAGDSLLIYAASLAKAVPLPGMDGQIVNSFTNRAEAILKWYTHRADAVFNR